MPRAALLVFAATLLVASCADRLRVSDPGTSRPRFEPETSPAGAEADPASSTPAAALRVPVAVSGERPLWLEAPLGDVELPQADLSMRSLVGRDIGLLRLDATLLVVHREEGVLGAARVGPTSWSAVLGDDTILVSVSRDLYRADAAGAIKGDWEYLGTYGDAIAWDVSAEHFVMATPWSAYRSTDGGASFEQVFVPPDSRTIANTEVRSDGTIAVLTYDASTPAMHWSRDGGATWQVASAPLPVLDRVGARLQYADSRGCVWALDADGRRWVRSDTWDASTSWALLGLSSARPRWRAHAELARHDEPAAPSRGEPLEASTSIRCSEGGAWSRNREIGELPRMLPPPLEDTFDEARCALGGLGCLARVAGPELESGRTDFAFLSDGVCVADDTQTCRAPARQPTLIRWNRETGYIEPLALPQSCAVPLETRAARGLGVLSCRAADGALSVYTVNDRLDVVHELKLPQGIDEVGFAQASDGTLAAWSSCPHSQDVCSVWLRDPTAPSGAGWREVEVGELFAFRVLPGGRLLTVSRTSGAPGFTLAFVEPDPNFWGNAFVLVEGLELEVPVHDLRVDPEGHLLLITENDGSRLALKLGRDGRVQTAY